MSFQALLTKSTLIRYTESVTQKGFAPILIVLFIAAAVGGYFIYSQNKPISSEQRHENIDIKMKDVSFSDIERITHPDGSAGTRTTVNAVLDSPENYDTQIMANFADYATVTLQKLPDGKYALSKGDNNLTFVFETSTCAPDYEMWRKVKETEFKIHITLLPENVNLITLKTKGPLLSYSDVYPICN